MKSTLILLLIAFTFLSPLLTAQHSYIPSKRTFTTKDGMSSDKVYALHKDRKGFIWIGTENGLDRFDGKSFKHFNTANQPKMTIRTVHNIMEDASGYLWLVKANETFEQSYFSPEINLYNIHTGHWATLEERFGEDLPLKINNIRQVKQLEDGSIFLFSPFDHKAYLYTSNGFKTIPLPQKIEIISDALMQKNKTILIEGGVFEQRQWNTYIFKLQLDGKVLSEEHANFIIPVSTDNNNSIQYLQLQPLNNACNGIHLAAYNHLDKNINSDTDHSTTRMDQAAWNKEQQLLWLKNYNTLMAVNLNNEVVFQQKEQFDFNRIPILFDGNNTWYSNKKEGLVKITLTPNYFQTHQFFDVEFDNSTRGIYAKNDGELWTSTIAAVVKKEATGNISKESHSLVSFTNFMKDKSDYLWYFYKNKIVKEHLSTHEIMEYDFEVDLEVGLKGWSLFEAKNGEIWVFGRYGHIYALQSNETKFKLKSKYNTNLELDIDVYDAQQRDHQTVWLCTSHGLYIVNNEGEFIALYNDEQKGKYYIPAKNIHHLYQDRNSTIWLATGDGGLLELKIRNSSHEARPSNYELRIKNQYTIKNGLSCNTLHAIYEDDDEYLWISSNDGLMQFDKRTTKVVNYFTENGLLHNEFNRIAHFQAEDGSLYFGGLNGMIHFYPKYFKNVRHQPNNAPLVVKDFYQYSTKEKQFKNFTHHLNQTQTITLQPNERFFKLQLALLDYQDGTTFQYRIKSLYDWQTTSNEELSISGLPYGTHTLEIKAFNNRQQEAQNTLTYNIEVLKPFYLQWWFLFLVLGSLGIAAFYFFKWRTQQLLVLQESEQLRQLDKMKSQFFVNISHELRTPITLILTPLANFLKKHQLSSTQIQELSAIQHNGNNLLNLVNEVLDLSKLEANKLELNLTSTKIPQFIERVVANFESAAAVKHIEFQFMSFLQKDFTALFDKKKLETILNNLLSNALKFTNKNGSIQIMVAHLENDLVIKIKDNGRGITAGNLSHIFDRYFQVKGENIEGGTGIGLALTKELVELMNGQISVKSQIEIGTEFEIKLPIQIVEQDLAIEENIENLNLRGFKNLLGFNQPDISTQKDTVLLVEDNPSLQNFIQSILAPFYNVIIKNNGLEALDYLTTHQLPMTNHLILSDLMMPEMDGYTFLEKIKSDDRFCSIPFIMLTARADIQDKLHALRIGVDDYLTKPFDVEELLLRIKKLISNAKNREDNNQIVTLSADKPKKAKLQVTNHQSLITSHDLDWLKQIETITLREIKNAHYSVDDLANELLIGKRQLFRKIKRITGLTPKKYMLTFRLQHARRLLETQDIQTLKEVGYSVGFENATHFAKLYEAEFGKRPHELLKKNV